MSDINDDQALLRRYTDTGCDQAFAELVSRHVHHVFSVARRETPDAHLAEELTQTAFIVLARKAKDLPPGTILSGWLFQTVRFAAKNARRTATRRQLQEQEIAHMSSLPPESEEATLWNQISPELNHVLASLSKADRDAITLRFFEQKSHTEIANILQTTELSARKRLSRAVEKLRVLLTKRGITVSSITLATLLLSHSVEAAPASLATSVAASAAIGTTSIGLPPLVTSTLEAMAVAKLKISLGLAALLLVSLGASVAIVSHHSKPTSTISASLSDGSTLRIVDVEVTDQVTFRYSRPLRFRDRLLLHLLPKSWSSKLVSSSGSGSVSMSTQHGKDALFLAAAHENRPTNSKLNLGRLVVIGDDGSTFDGTFNSGTLGFDDAQLTAWHLHAFPRRGNHLRLRFLYEDPQGAWQLATELSITNPVAGPFVEWVPEPLPILRTNADLELRLTGFKTTAKGLANHQTQSPRWSAFPTTQWVLDAHPLRESGMPWVIRSVDIADATGNEWSPMELETWSEPSGSAGARLHAAMIGALWSSEPAWKLRFELSRTNDFRPDELFSIARLRVPARGEILQLNETRRIGDATVTFLTLSGLEAELREPFRWMTDKSKVNLALRWDGTTENHRLTLVQISDDQDRLVPFEDPRPPYAQTQFVFSFSPQPNAKTFSFRFARHSSRFVEFRAKPTNLENPPPGTHRVQRD